MFGIFSVSLGVLLALALALVIVFFYLKDITQKKHAIPRNYPLVGRLRYFFEQLGEYFRQYFFLGDRDERPFNRSTRSWVYRMAQNEGGCDVIMRIGTAKYGVRDEHGRLSDAKLRELAAHDELRAFEIKLSQGAKPGKGGVLPGGKVTAEIARIRGSPEGEDSFSPNRHPEITNMDQLLDMVLRVREVTGKPVGLKTAIGGWQFMNLLTEAVVRRGLADAPDFIAVWWCRKNTSGWRTIA